MRRAGAFLLALGILAQQQEPPTKSAKSANAAELRDRLTQIQSQLKKVDTQLDGLKRRRKGLLVDLQHISLQRDRVRSQMDGARLRRDEAQAEVLRLNQESQHIRDEIQKLRAELKKQIRWMQASGPFGGMAAIQSFGDLESFLRQSRAMAWFREQGRRRLEAVQQLQGGLAKRKEALKAVLARLAADESDASQLQAALRVQEERLRGYLDGLSQDEGAQKRMHQELAEEAVQMQRLLEELLGRPKSGAFEAATNFATLRGELPPPVEGGLAQGFGEHVHPKFRTRTVQSGVLIEAKAGAPVTAVADGKVVFADYYQSYGPMVILDHGGGYHTLYTHLRNLYVAKDQVLRQGETLGTVGEDLGAPRLGFELRQGTKPEDPQKWLKRRYR